MSNVHLSPPNRRYVTGGHYHSTAFEEKAAAVTGQGVLNGFTVTNKNGSAIYIFICDATSAPTLAKTILPPIKVPATDGTVSYDNRYGIPFTTGLYFAASSTLSTYTALGSNDIVIAIDYAVEATNSSGAY